LSPETAAYFFIMSFERAPPRCVSLDIWLHPSHGMHIEYEGDNYLESIKAISEFITTLGKGYFFAPCPST